MTTFWIILGIVLLVCVLANIGSVSQQRIDEPRRNWPFV
jgi:hypothetical protein